MVSSWQMQATFRFLSEGVLSGEPISIIASGPVPEDEIGCCQLLLVYLYILRIIGFVFNDKIYNLGVNKKIHWV